MNDLDFDVFLQKQVEQLEKNDLPKYNNLKNNTWDLNIKYVVYQDDERCIGFNRGQFDSFRVLYIKNGRRFSLLLDEDYFNYLKLLGEVYGNQKIFDVFDDFALKKIYQTDKLIEEAKKLDKVFVGSKFFWIIMGLVMYAEDVRTRGGYGGDNLSFVWLKRNIKRYAAYKILIKNLPVSKTVLSMRQKWTMTKDEMIDNGIYVSLEDYIPHPWDDKYDLDMPILKHYWENTSILDK